MYFLRKGNTSSHHLQKTRLDVTRLLHGETIESESDAVGTDISKKDDGHVGGQKFLAGKCTRANIKKQSCYWSFYSNWTNCCER